MACLPRQPISMQFTFFPSTYSHLPWESNFPANDTSGLDLTPKEVTLFF